MTAIENKELQGVTARFIYAIIVSTCVIVGGGLGAYYGLKLEIVNVQTQNEIRQVEFDALKTQVNANKLQIDALQKAFNEFDKKH